jgi:hypothetical protein
MNQDTNAKIALVPKLPSLAELAASSEAEIFKNDGKKEILFIDTYANEKSEEIPEGYLAYTEIINPILYKGFNICKTIGVNYKLRKFPDDLI